MLSLSAKFCGVSLIACWLLAFLGSVAFYHKQRSNKVISKALDTLTLDGVLFVTAKGAQTILAACLIFGIFMVGGLL